MGYAVLQYSILNVLLFVEVNFAEIRVWYTAHVREVIYYIIYIPWK